MSVPNIDKQVQNALKGVVQCYSRIIPVKVGKEVVSSVRQNFRSGGFYGDTWQTTKRQQVPFKGAAGRYGPLLSRSTHLMSNTDYVPGHGQVTIRNTAPHAQYHNEGATSKVTKKMKRFFWAKHYEAGGGKKKGKKQVKRAIQKRIQEAFNQAENCVLEVPDFVERSDIHASIKGYLSDCARYHTIVVKWRDKCLIYSNEI